MPALRLRIEGFHTAAQRLDDVGDRARAPEPALRAPETLADLKAGQAKRFASKAGWKPISPRWAQEKRRRGLDDRVMRMTGRLERALTQTADKAEGIVFHAYNKELRWGIKGGRTPLYYAAILARPGRNRPARKVVVMRKETRIAIATRIETYVNTGRIPS